MTRIRYTKEELTIYAKHYLKRNFYALEKEAQKNNRAIGGVYKALSSYGIIKLIKQGKGLHYIIDAMNEIFDKPTYKVQNGHLKKIEEKAHPAQGLEQFCRPQKSEAELRDEFAGKALQGLLANSYSDPNKRNMAWSMGYEQVAEYSYKYADAMLRARKGG